MNSLTSVQSVARYLSIACKLCAFILMGAESSRAEHEVEITLPTTTAFWADSCVPIPVTLVNQVDTIAAFELWFKLHRPDVAVLSLEMDTVGCLIGGWA